MYKRQGYDPAVRFWKDKGFAVRRFNVNFCKQAVQRRKNIKYQVVADIPSREDNANTNTNININTDTDIGIGIGIGDVYKRQVGNIAQWAKA